MLWNNKALFFKCIFFLILLLSGTLSAQEHPPVSDGAYYNFIVPLAEKSKAKQVFDKQSFELSPEDESEIMRAIKSSFALPFEEWMQKKHDSEWRNLIAGFSGGFSMGYPLTRTESQQGSGRQGNLNVNNITYSASLKYKPLGNWFISAAATKYKYAELQRSWNPDFVYTFGYSDWRPYTLSLVYANYGGNRFNPNRSAGEKATIFKQGAWTLGWKFPIEKKYSKYLTFSEKGSIGCNTGYTVVPEYFDAATNGLRKWKRTLSFGCKFTIVGAWYVNFTAFHYLDKSQQQPWNPDYTYGFGYFDWRPGTVTIQYNNYSGNRWPGREPANGTGEFKNGGLSVAWSWSF